MDDAMADAADVGAVVAVAKPIRDEAESGPGVADTGIQRDITDRLVGAVFRRELRARADPFDLSPRFERPRIAFGPAIDRERQARRPGVDDDGVVVHGDHTEA